MSMFLLVSDDVDFLLDSEDGPFVEVRRGVGPLAVNLFSTGSRLRTETLPVDLPISSLKKHLS